MRILIMGAGKMGSFFIDLLSFDHEVAVYEKDAKRLRFTYNCYRFTKMEEVDMFRPELVINAVTLKYTIPVFEELLPHLSSDCIISDIASVKTGLQEFYEKSGFRFVSTDAPGTTFKRHMQIAKGVLNEDDYLLQEILFNPYTSGQVAQIREELAELIDIIDHKDAKRMKLFLTKIRNHVKEDIEIRQ